MLKLNISDLMDTMELMNEVSNGYVQEKFHPDKDLALYVYDNSCVYDGRWNNVTKQARGLILDNIGEVIALPFPKTFLVDVHLTEGEDRPAYATPLPEGEFKVTTKEDGSLAIVYWHGGKWNVASKGSFASDVSIAAQAYLDTKNTKMLDRSLTYLAEWVSPENRIVVDYGGLVDLILLGARSLYTGAYQRLETLEEGWAPIGSVVRQWAPATNPRKLAELIKTSEHQGTKFEGVVLQWPDGTMAKCKNLKYIALHGMYTEMSEKGIWRVLSTGGSLTDLMDRGAPDELMTWAKGVEKKLKGQRSRLKGRLTREYNKAMLGIAYDAPTARKQFAMAVAGSEFSKVLFMLYDNNTVGLDKWLWKQVEPFGKVKFRKDEGE